MDFAAFIPPKARCVVEFGCGDGSTGQRFRQIQPECRYIGVDTDASALTVAAGRLSQTVRESFPSMDLARYGIGQVDALVYHSAFLSAGALVSKLREQAEYLADGGQMVFFLDNPGYLRNVLALWQGKTPLYPGALALPEVVRGIAAAGLKLDVVQPQHDMEDALLAKRPEMQQLIHSFVAFCQAQQVRMQTDMWAQSFVVRAMKCVRPEPSMVLQTIIGEATACARVRIHEPHQFCRTMFGVSSDDRVGGANLEIGKHYQQRVVIRQRMRMTRGLTDLLELEKVVMQDGYVLMFEMDDNPMLWREQYEAMHFADFIYCHAIQVSTPRLAAFMRHFNPNVVVFPNELTYLPEPRVYPADGPVTIFFGALNRGADWQEIMPVLNELLAQYGDRVQVRVVFDRSFYDELRTEHKELVGTEYPKGFAPYSVYEDALHGSDIALLPLRDTPFNVMKSDLKFIECAGHGTVALASPTVYADTVQDGVTGCIYHNVEEFRVKLTMLIENRERRQRIATAAYEYVKEHRLLSQHYEERVQFYRSLCAHLPELNQDMARRLAKLKEVMG